MKKKMMGMALMGAIVCFGFSQTQATTISFDPTGAGGPGFEMDTFDWSPSSALAVGVVPITGVTQAFSLYTYASLGNFLTGNTPVSGTGLNEPGGYEITFVAGFGETVTSVGNDFARFSYDASNPVNFFEMYIHDAQNADNSLLGEGVGGSSGTGFEDGTLILSGKITDSTDGFFLNPTVPLSPLDQFGPDEFSQVFGPGTTNTVDGFGGGTSGISATIGNVLVNPLYFPDITGGTVGFTINFNTSFVTPFNQVDPATQVWDATAGAYITPNVGAVNGVTGPDFLFQVDANQSQTPVPEPATMLLFGTGLIGLAGIARRKRSKK